MGQHVWLLLATIGTELLVIFKWSKGQYPQPLPKVVKWSWAVGASMLVLYPILRVSSFRWLSRCRMYLTMVNSSVYLVLGGTLKDMEKRQ